jgi:hypothetical protein
LPPVFTLVSCSAYSSTLKMEVICSSETLVDFLRTTRRYIPEDSSLQSRSWFQKMSPVQMLHHPWCRMMIIWGMKGSINGRACIKPCATLLPEAGLDLEPIVWERIVERATAGADLTLLRGTLLQRGLSIVTPLSFQPLPHVFPSSSSGGSVTQGRRNALQPSMCSVCGV